MSSILVVDDEPEVRRALKRILERAGHQVTEAPDGAKALRWFAGQPTDVVICDIYMPEMDGIEFLIRVQEAFPEARVIAMSGGGFISQDNLLEAASNLGAAGVLPKPFGLDEVLDQVARALAAKK